MTPLDKTLKRLVKIGREDFVVTLSPEALKVTRKGHQRGVEMRWESLVSGESALAVALQASVGKFDLAAGTGAPARAPARRTSSAPPLAANASSPPVNHTSSKVRMKGPSKMRANGKSKATLGARKPASRPRRK